MNQLFTITSPKSDPCLERSIYKTPDLAILKQIFMLNFVLEAVRMQHALQKHVNQQSADSRS